jgi:transcriptional regulator with XRE-family HTH domain
MCTLYQISLSLYRVNTYLDKNTTMLTATQCKMARAALDWGVRDLAGKTGLSANTISRFEGGANANTATLKAIRQAFMDAGVRFLANGGVVPPKESGE